ncbi:hypothetical protein [Endozoicomonas ascidiicola]|uniref:hypothetical protein n=1 Tax=Endozoicomonas ascidiicola TaxID=1698521 RepID=UPI000830333F|nr:hypothetical protein [Endozoicomonas ascidiicola]
MIYVLRDENNEISAISEKPLSEQWHSIDTEDEGLKQFLKRNPDAGNQLMETSDIEFIRVLEDVIDLLIDKEVIQFTEFPDAVQRKLLNRRRYRESLRSQSDATQLLENGDTIF